MESKYFTTNICKRMNAMYDMHDPNTVLHQQLPNLSLEYFKVDTFVARASDIVLLIDDQTRGGVHGLH